MTDKLGSVPASEAGEPGQASDSGGPANPSLNLDDLPEYRAVKSGYDRKIAERDKRIASLAAQVEQMTFQAQKATAREQRVTEAVRSADPDAYSLLAAEAGIAEREAEVQHLRQQMQRYEQERAYQQQAQDYKRQIEDQARRRGLDPYAAPLQDAINRALAGDVDAVWDALLDLEAQKRQEAPPAPSSSAVHPPLPPAGGASPDPQDVLRREYDAEKRNLRQGDYDGLFALKTRYRARGLTGL